jgi:hypothetical protein
MTHMAGIRLWLGRWLLRMARWLLAESSEKSPSAGSGGEFADGFYRKLPVEMVRECVRRKGKGGWTPTTTHVLACLLARIDIRANRAELSRRELAQLTGLDKETAAQHAKLLAAAGWIAIEGRTAGPGRNLPNLYRVAGDFAGTILYGEPIPQDGGRIPSNEEDRRTNPTTLVGELGESLLNTLQQTLRTNTHKHRQGAPEGAVPAGLVSKSSFSGNESDSGVVPERDPPLDDAGKDAPPERTMMRGPGLGLEKTQELVEQYGHAEFATVVSMAQGRDLRNPGGWIIAVLKRRAEEKPQGGTDPQRYISGEYAGFIEH